MIFNMIYSLCCPCFRGPKQTFQGRLINLVDGNGLLEMEIMNMYEVKRKEHATAFLVNGNGDALREPQEFRYWNLAVKGSIVNMMSMKLSNNPRIILALQDLAVPCFLPVREKCLSSSKNRVTKHPSNQNLTEHPHDGPRLQNTNFA